tara:strand:+ start:1550 stop:2389 length:840 start_codon:yes stop_codon:yes gene_type:complete
MDNRFVILTEYFRSSNGNRRKEINKSIEVNCRIPQTKRVVIFIDPEVEFPPSLKHILSEENYDKIELHYTEPGGRSTYSDIFSYANEHLIGENCVLCNNDISFDETLDLLRETKDFDLDGHFISLTRWDVMLDNSLRFKQPAKIRKNSQDAWAFRPSLPLKMIDKGGFYMGRPGCDGMVAYLATISGLKVFNPSEVVKAKHLHLCRHRTYGRKHRMGGDDIYMCVHPTSHIVFEDSKLMYRFGNPKRDVDSQEAIDRALEFEKENDIHWDYAIEKCRSR